MTWAAEGKKEEKDQREMRQAGNPGTKCGLRQLIENDGNALYTPYEPLGTQEIGEGERELTRKRLS